MRRTVTIVIKDKEDGGIGANIKFNPAVRDVDPQTPATELGTMLLRAIKDILQGEGEKVTS